MRIGLSYSRCIRDIIEGKVDIKDVLIIIARTDFDPHDDKQWEDIWRGYGGGQTVGSVLGQCLNGVSIAMKTRIVSVQ